MYLKSLELSGFKSFAKKTDLLFSTPITAIVGPNGSGKSNIAEAFRFVLGEQSIKSMRGKRTEDLIFNGSRELSRANRASVKVVFDNRKKLLNVDFDEVTIERVIYRDSSSEYLVNGTQVRLRDIVELLAKAHIGASGHHIISQGEADKILNANLIERREMLEDALGLKIYQYKKEESERKLLKTEENIGQVGSLRREVAPQLKFLKKQVEKIERTIELKKELLETSREYVRREEAYLEVSGEKLEKEKAGPAAELARLGKELRTAKEVLAGAPARDKKGDQILSVEAKLSELREKKDGLVRELGRIEGAIGSEERIMKKERSLTGKAGEKVVPLSEVKTFVGQIEDSVGEVHDPNEGGWEKFIETIRRLVREFIAKYESGENTLGRESEEALRTLSAEKKGIEEKLSVLREEEARLHQVYDNIKAEIEKEKDTSREAERAVFRIMSEENAVRAVLARLENEESRLAVIAADLKRELREVAVLIGREALDFETAVVLNADGRALSREELAAGERGEQEERRRRIEKMKIRIEDAGAGSGEDVVREYKEVSERDEFLARELVDLEKSAESLRGLIRELEERLSTEFKVGVEKINSEFQKYFTLMFGGGTALLAVVREKRRKEAPEDEELALVAEMEGKAEEEEEEEREGIEIEVNLPRKKTKGLMMLSGGERALTSIALLFAMSSVNPPPFIILDETDAALDEANSKKYGDMIENLSKVSQLILITHNRETMSRAGILYGVTMGSGGVSKLLSIQFDEAVAVAK